ncbi:MAG: ADP-ribosylglycohydrolase family protein [Clostridia bacterium]|nr:ADP-ribosylglycohydrolase family protein [Clostridia bacterium]
MIDEKTLYDKIYACWLGKNIGGTLGGPVEGRMQVLDLTWYPVLSENGALPNDDLDLQLVNLHVLQTKGASITADDIADAWREHVFFPFDEYGAASTNMRMGFKPPYSGYLDNVFTDCMGSPIRSEIWAAVAAGDPELAAALAVRDAVVDHAGGEGVNGEIFNAALQAKAYVCDDIEILIESALACIPEQSRVYKAVAYALELFRDGKTLPEARELILGRFGSPNFTNAPQNIAFGICGILWGKDFEDSILKTVNLGYDTDCTVATAAATLGIMYGTSYIPEKWSRPIGEKITVSDMIKGLKAPADLDELTRESIRLYKVLKNSDREAIIAATPSRIDAGYQTYVITSDEKSGIYAVMRYLTDPMCAPGYDCRVSFEIRNNSSFRCRFKADVICPENVFCDDEADITVEPGWAEKIEFTLKACAMPDMRFSRACLRLTRINDGSVWTEYRLPFALLRPNVWRINGQEKYFPCSTVKLDGDAPEYVCTTTLCEPQSRSCMMFCNSENPLKLELDGKVIFDSDGALYLPAYNRSPRSQRAEFNIEGGEHEVKVTVKNAGKSPKFYFTCNSGHACSEPGSFYMHIEDVLK